MNVSGCFLTQDQMILSFAISVMVLIYFLLVLLESPWSNKGAISWLPQDCCFPVPNPPHVSNKLGLGTDFNVEDMKASFLSNLLVDQNQISYM